VSDLKKEFSEFSMEMRKYLEERAEIIKLDIIERFLVIFSGLLTIFIAILLFFGLFLYLSMSAGFYIGEITGKTSIGFLIVATVYVAITVLILIFRKAIIVRPFMKFVLGTMFNNINTDPDEDEGL